MRGGAPRGHGDNPVSGAVVRDSGRELAAYHWLLHVLSSAAAFKPMCLRLRFAWSAFLLARQC